VRGESHLPAEGHLTYDNIWKLICTGTHQKKQKKEIFSTEGAETKGTIRVGDQKRKGMEVREEGNS